MRDRARLPAVPLLVFMLVMASWGGLLGVLMAPALFAVLLLAYRRLYVPGLEAGNGGAGYSSGRKCGFIRDIRQINCDRVVCVPQSPQAALSVGSHLLPGLDEIPDAFPLTVCTPTGAGSHAFF